MRTVFREGLRVLALGGLAVLFFYGAFQPVTEDFSAAYFYVLLGLSASFFALAAWRLVIILRSHGHEDLI
jgi:hypothetical protein